MNSLSLPQSAEIIERFYAIDEAVPGRLSFLVCPCDVQL